MKRFLLSLLFAIYGIAFVIFADDTIAMDSTIRYQHIVVTNTNVPQNEQTSAVNISNGGNSDTIINWIADLLGSTKAVITWEAIIVIILIIIIIIIGVYGIRTCKKLVYLKIDIISERIKKHDSFINDLKLAVDDNSRIVNDIQADANQIDRIRQSLQQQEEYLNQMINVFSNATYASINQMTDKDQAKKYLNQLTHDLQITRLYRTNLDVQNNDKIAALEYLMENGTIEDITHLEYVVQHDPNEKNRRRAIEVIAVIRSRG